MRKGGESARNEVGGGQQLMANELGWSHVVVSLLYFGLQLVISLVMIYLVPASV